MRHRYATHLIEAGIDFDRDSKILGKILGHQSIWLNPREYLEDTQRQLPRTLQRNIDTLPPQNWKRETVK